MQRVATALVMLALATGCGLDPDRWPSGKPKIDRLTFQNQSPQDPLGLQFGVRFSDSDGDASLGVLHLSINGQATAELSMKEIFESQRPPMPLEATKGEFEVVVRLSEETDLKEVLRIGFVIEDGQARRSNEPWIEVMASVPPGDPMGGS